MHYPTPPTLRYRLLKSPPPLSLRKTAPPDLAGGAVGSLVFGGVVFKNRDPALCQGSLMLFGAS